MITNFGENLRNLRRQKDLTQEDVSKILNVSTQSISRWETNMGYPDIEMLPAIANFYNVSVDSLLCVDVNSKNEKINQILDQVYSLRNIGDISSCIKILRETLKEYPYDFKIMITLASCIKFYGKTDEEEANNKKEAVEICENILQDCLDDSIRHSAIQLLCYIYPQLGKKDKAIEMAKKLPTYNITSNELVIVSLEGTEAKNYIHWNLNSLLQIITHNVERLFILYQDPHDKISILKSLIGVYKAFFDKEDYYFFDCYLQQIYRYIGALYVDLKDYNKALEYIEKAKDHAISYDTRAEEHTHISSMFLGLETSKKDSITDSTKNQSWVLLERLTDERYNYLRNNPKFKAIIKSLEENTKQ